MRSVINSSKMGFIVAIEHRFISELIGKSFINTNDYTFTLSDQKIDLIF